MKYIKFKIENYRAIDGPLEINIDKNKLVPLIGTNECGKTTILQAIYTFDYANDKEYDGRHLENIRNYYDPQNQKNAIITATISITKIDFLNCLSDELREKYKDIPSFRELKITRNLDTKKYAISCIADSEDTDIIGKAIVSRLPYIIYNDDFIERPKNEIEIPEQGTDLFGWFGIYERAFKKSNSSIYDVIEELDDNIKQGIISDVESEINKTLLSEWGKISLDDSECLSIKLNIINENKIIKVQIVEKVLKKDRFFNIENRSKGFLWFFNFVMKIKYNPKSNGLDQDIIYLFDEPGSYLHSVAQEKLCKMILNIANKEGRVIYCTHTHHLLDPKYIPPKCILIVQKNKNKFIELKRIYEMKLKTKKYSELQPVYEALGIADWDFFTQDQKVILVEGIYDKYALEIFCNIIPNVILPGVNAESVYNNIPKLIAYNKKYIAIWDNDDEGRQYYEKACKNFGLIEKSKYILLPKEPECKKVRMEEMFEEEDFKLFAKKLNVPENTSYENIMINLITTDDSIKNNCINGISKYAKNNFKVLTDQINNLLK